MLTLESQEHCLRVDSFMNMPEGTSALSVNGGFLKVWLHTSYRH